MLSSPYRLPPEPSTKERSSIMSVIDPTFKEWIRAFVETDTNLGDLAKDILKDPNFPNSSDKDTLVSYLHRCHADPRAVRTLSAAVDLYEAADGAHIV